ncbi:MAG: P1 family peptidase [Caldilineaceae bacterium]|nr:P1 family peptidase [Caldilineaceae bacterium]MCB0139753.1 P1 family peptidase [Caldilineaceae bacterium]MCB9149516.1 P1 family peptidase [Caldilineaceae bacterium]
MNTGHNSLTDIPGLQVGHWTNTEAATGCTVILCPEGAVAGVDVRGGAPGTREIALLDPVCTVERVNAVLLTGGSAFGLAAADGVVRWLEEHGYGFDVGVAKVPIVPAAVLFDLATGNPNVRPDASAGYAACQAASAGTVAEGNVGAGTGATVGKMLGLDRASKGGLGTASRHIGQDLIVAALVAVNAIGSVIDPATQRIIAGARLDDGSFAHPRQMTENHLRNANLTPGANTTIAVVATNAALTKTEATKVAQMAHDGLARVINPIHTASDGDTIFALSLGNQSAPASLIGAVAAEVLSEAVLRAVGE